MKLLPLMSVSTMIFVLSSFLNCSSSKELQDNAPVNILNPYFQYWTAGVKGGGAGVDVYLPVDGDIKETVVLDSIYFRNMSGKLEKSDPSQKLFIGHLKNAQNAQNDLILSSDPKEEFKNKLPESYVRMPFKIEEDECIISYKENGETKYFKVENLEEREGPKYPEAKKNE